MKKFLIAVLIIGATLQLHAQRAEQMGLAAGDTIVNAGTATKTLTVTGGYSGAVIQPVLTKISGTGAGTLKLLGSLDGTNYVQIGSSFTITDVTTQSTTFYVASPLPQYLRVTASGSGTESVQLKVFYRLPKYQTQ